MNRRQLLKTLMAAPAIAAVPELILPSRKIFLPPRQGWPLGALTLDIDDLTIEQGHRLKRLYGRQHTVAIACGSAYGLAQGYVSAEQLPNSFEYLTRDIRIRGVPGDWRIASTCWHQGPELRAHVNLMQVWRA